MRLHLGCGNNRKLGFLNVDFIRTSATDVADDITRLTSLSQHQGQVDMILCEHALEHLSFDDSVRAIGLWKDFLRPGGTLILEVPDVVQDCVEFAQCPDITKAPDSLLSRYPILQRLKASGNWGIYTSWGRMRNIYGAQDTEGQFHKSGWWKERLQEVLDEAGFEKVQIMRSVDVEVDSLPALFTIHAQEEPCVRAWAKKGV